MSSIGSPGRQNKQTDDDEAHSCRGNRRRQQIGYFLLRVRKLARALQYTIQRCYWLPNCPIRTTLPAHLWHASKKKSVLFWIKASAKCHKNSHKQWGLKERDRRQRARRWGGTGWAEHWLLCEPQGVEQLFNRPPRLNTSRLTSHTWRIKRTLKIQQTTHAFGGLTALAPKFRTYLKVEGGC